MTSKVVIHKQFIHDVAPKDWVALDLHCLLLGEQSTAAPGPGDAYLGDIDVEDNELIAGGYVRQTCSGQAVAWNATTKLWELTAATTWFPTITPTIGGDAVTAAIFYVPGVTDDLGMLVLSAVPLFAGLPSSIALTGSTFNVAWPDPIPVGYQAP